MIEFICNNEYLRTEKHSATALLDFLRDDKSLKGVKEGCREGDCGACSVLSGSMINGRMKYEVINSCLIPLIACNGKHIVTIEGLQTNPNIIHQSFIDEAATQCGFCTPGFIISITGYLLCNKPVYEEALDSLSGNICRCTGHTTIKSALKKIVDYFTSQDMGDDQLPFLISNDIVPSYFSEIPERISKIKSSIENTERIGNIIIAGGTDIMLQKGGKLLDEDILLKEEKDLDGIFLSEGNIIISGNTTVSDFEKSDVIGKYFPEMNSFLKLFGSKQIRNRATLAGNIVNASPIADSANILLALNASLVLLMGDVERILPLDKFYLGYKQLDLKSGEIIKQIVIEAPKNKYYFNFEKVSKRTYLDIASVNSSMYIESDGNIINRIRLSAGGVAPHPLYLKKCSEYLVGKNINIDILKQAAEIMVTEIMPISDIRGSREYKTLLLKQLLFAHFSKIDPTISEGLNEKY